MDPQQLARILGELRTDEQHMPGRTYLLVDYVPRILTDAHARGILCLVCGRTSWYIEDVRHRYCAFCHVFHDERGRRNGLQAGTER